MYILISKYMYQDYNMKLFALTFIYRFSLKYFLSNLANAGGGALESSYILLLENCLQKNGLTNDEINIF